jgi:hypothetical protein
MDGSAGSCFWSERGVTRPFVRADTANGVCMVTREDLESYLIHMDLDWEEVDDGMYLVQGRNSGLPMVVHHADNLLLIRLKVMDMPASTPSEADFYRTLLELNATDVVHGAYGIEDGELILSDTLELETLDLHEIRASMESIELAATSHMERIRSMAGVGAED